MEHASDSTTDFTVLPEDLVRSFPHVVVLAEYSNLFLNLEIAAGTPPNDLLQAVKRLPDSLLLPPPVRTWCFLNFVAGEDRRIWAGTTLLPRIARDREILKALRPGEQLNGRVPARPDWLFRIRDWGHMFRCQVQHCVSGEVIELTTPGPFRDTAEMLFGGVPDEHRRACLLSSQYCDADWNAVEDDDRIAIAHWLAQRLPTLQAAINTFHQRWKEKRQRIWLASLLGDWINAHAAALQYGDGPLTAEIERRVMAWLAQTDQSPFLVEPRGLTRPWHWAVGVLTRHHVAYLDYLLGPKLSQEARDMPAQLPMILDEDLPGWEEDLLNWFLSSREPIEGETAARTAAYLLRRGIRAPEVIEALLRHTCDDPERWNLLSALVAIRYDPKRAKRLFRQGLRCPDDGTLLLVLAALAISDWGWVDGLLEKALRKKKSKTPISEAACRLAVAWRKRRESSALPPRAEKKDRTMLVLSSDPDSEPFRYIGTIEDLFECSVQTAREWHAIADRELKTAPRAVSADLGE